MITFSLAGPQCCFDSLKCVVQATLFQVMSVGFLVCTCICVRISLVRVHCAHPQWSGPRLHSVLLRKGCTCVCTCLLVMLTTWRSRSKVPLSHQQHSRTDIGRVFVLHVIISFIFHVIVSIFCRVAFYCSRAAASACKAPTVRARAAQCAEGPHVGSHRRPAMALE